MGVIAVGNVGFPIYHLTVLICRLGHSDLSCWFVISQIVCFVREMKNDPRSRTNEHENGSCLVAGFTTRFALEASSGYYLKFAKDPRFRSTWVSEELDMPEEAIEVRGARVNNLKNISFSIPINLMTVVTGVSGSGKSSLAFDTVYAEGQRRYVESLSAYARQFLERMDKPDVDEVRGIAPAIAIRQKNSTRNPRSTVGTQTEVHDYLRLLYARVGTTYCRVCGREVYRDSPQSVADEVLSTIPAGTRFYVLFPAGAGLGEVGVSVEETTKQGDRETGRQGGPEKGRKRSPRRPVPLLRVTPLLLTS